MSCLYSKGGQSNDKQRKKSSKSTYGTGAGQHFFGGVSVQAAEAVYNFPDKDNTVEFENNQLAAGSESKDVTLKGSTSDTAQYNHFFQGNVKIIDSEISGNALKANGAQGGAAYFYSHTTDSTQNTVTIDGGSIHDNSVSYENSGEYTGQGVAGGAIFVKGSDVTFKDVEIHNNSAIGSKAMGMGGAIYVDSTINDPKNHFGVVNFEVTKDLTYYGNKVEGSKGSFADTYGSYANTAGGFLYLDRGAKANFNISSGATLTIGKEGETDENVDTIASAIKGKSGSYEENVITKTGEGTLTINSTLNNYHGTLHVNEGTMNVTQSWNTSGEVTVADGAVLNLAGTTTLKTQNETIEYFDDKGKKHEITLPTKNAELTVAEGASFKTDKLEVNDSASLSVSGDVAFDSLTLNGNGTAEFTSSATIHADASKLGDGSSLISAEHSSNLTLAEGSTISLSNMEKGKTYSIVNDAAFDLSKVTFESDNFIQNLVIGADGIKISDTNKTVLEALGFTTAMDGVIAAAGDAGSGKAYDYFQSIAKSDDAIAVKQGKVDSLTNLGELAGLSHSAYSVSNLFTDSVSSHLEKRHDSDVWAQYIHNKESVDGLGLAGVRADYDATYDGIVAGIDLVNNDSFQGGVAFTYTNGSISGSNGYAYTENDADYYGISLYGRKEMAGYALLGDVTYLHGSNDITQWNNGARITASPDVDAISLGVKALKDMKAGNGTITPYIGARYLRLNTESYTSSLGMHYDADSQNLFLIPVGVNYSTTIQNGAWSIRPVIGVGYVWNLGDRTNDQTVSLGNGVSSFSYDTTDAGSLIAKIGIGAEKGNYAFGVGYEYQDGSTVSADKWTVSASMRF